MKCSCHSTLDCGRILHDPTTKCKGLLAPNPGPENHCPSCRKSRSRVGEIEIGSVDLAMIHDSGGPRRVAPILERLGVEVWDPKTGGGHRSLCSVFDAESRAILDLARDWVKNRECPDSMMRRICHVVLPENGYLKPGMFAVGGDSHSPTGGAFGCYMFGIGATEMAGSRYWRDMDPGSRNDPD